MKIEVLDNSCIGITLSTHQKDEYYISQRSLVEDGIATSEVNLNMALDRAIELRDELTEIINREVGELNAENPEQIAKEIADVIDWSYKEK
jgi:hypothetical protein